ncbi:MAG: hypothetical protein LV479_05465 [Methylacidiphilales bacterium]|nr:hypothetical protein [Candidatus Methylacidiphilales bacterium]
MGVLRLIELTAFIESAIEKFHQRRLESLEGIKLKRILSRKNPYLFRAKNILTAEELVRGILDAHLSSQEEALFGTTLEQLAIYIAKQIYGGRKSASEGIDLQFEREGMIYLITIKSGPNWGNSRQIAAMRDDFRKAKRILGTNAEKGRIICVNGCAYGKARKADYGDYLKLCGQEFWELLSGSETLYIDIIKPFGSKAKEKNEVFLVQYAAVVNKFVREFTTEYCDVDGKILWDKIVKLSSEKKQ